MWSESLARRLDPEVFAALEQANARLSQLEAELAEARSQASAALERAASLEGEVAALTDAMKGVAVFVWGSSDINELDRLVLTFIQDSGGSRKAGEVLREVGATKGITQGSLDKLYRLGLLSGIDEDASLSPWARRLMALSEGYRSMVGVGPGGLRAAEAKAGEDAEKAAAARADHG